MPDFNHPEHLIKYIKQSLVSSEKLIKVTIVLILLTLILLQLYLRLLFIDTLGYPADYNGFFYLKEIQYRILHGSGYYVKHSPFFFSLSLAGKWLNLSAETIVRFLPLFSTIIFAIGIWIVAFKRPLLGIFLCGAIFISDAFFYFHYGYARQALGISLVVLGFAIWKLNPKKMALAVAGLFIVLLGSVFHLFSAGLAVFLFFFVEKMPLGKIVGLFAAIGLISELIRRPKNILAQLELGRGFEWEFAVAGNYISKVEWAEYWSFYIITLFALIILIRSKIWRLLPLCVLFIALTLPIWSDKEMFSFRFMLSSISVFFIFMSLLISETQKANSRFGPERLILLLFSMLFISKLCLSDKPRRLGPGMPLQSITSNIRLLEKWLPKDAFVQAPPGVQYRISYLLDRASAIKVPKDRLGSQYFQITMARPGCPEPDQINEQDLKNISCIQLDKTWVIRRKSDS
ncbi:MAG: hypothetical protein GYA55_05505 [SAR324 cluster bacterium]|uniref:Uncharacterized protein n=1 Tax=SAR324 cluster bacterium TaxID=2024889 RepID=A0A7X9IK04_9DELT|nr:hypothetical protein [SAR324 cluster bacterium]